MAARRPLGALYVCYLSLVDPLVHTQVVAYLRGLAAAGHRMHLLTFETGRLTRVNRRRWRERLAADGIVWHGLRYHKRPSLPATVFDTIAGALYAAWIVRRHGLEVLHARSHVPAAMCLITRRLAVPSPALIFDIRGLMAEEYVDAGRWPDRGLAWRLTKSVERAAIKRADGIVVLTERVRRQLFVEEQSRRVHVIPCCADFSRLAGGVDRRSAVRAELGLEESVVMVYVGKFGGWYMAGEMVDFFTAARRAIPRLRFVILSQDGHPEIEQALRVRGAGQDDYRLLSVSPERLGDYLAAADFGISFIRPSPSKVSSSPTKVGEYLAAGLPVVSTAGVGDLDTLITSDVGTLVSEHSDAAYAAAAGEIARLVADAATAERCRGLARRELSLAEVGIPRYRSLYDQVGGLVQRRSAPFSGVVRDRAAATEEPG